MGPVAGLVALVLVAGLVGGGVAAGLGAGSSPGSSRRALTSAPAIKGISSDKIHPAAIAAKVEPAVVDITSTLGYQNGTAAGTGMVLTSSGEVLTNNHVVEGATSISARIDGKGRTYGVKVLGTDPTADVALLQLVGASGLDTVTLGSSSSLAVGQPVVAIGNALDLQGPPTVTVGIVSALGRSINAGDSMGASEHLTDLIQTDAPLAPGNSGGPLLNAAGQVIGMNTAAATGSSGTQAASNIGFAIPIGKALPIVNQVRAGHASSAVQIGQRGFIGVDVTSVGVAQSSAGGLGGSLGGSGGPGYVPPVRSGAVVAQVVPKSPAQSAGMAAGDVIVSFQGKAVASPQSLTQLITGHHPGDKVSIGWVDQSGGHHSASLTLGTGPVA
ncbi:MAG: S1C family serine protease [Acidimicrobiales bacterium]